jgi:hypothetical protein
MSIEKAHIINKQEMDKYFLKLKENLEEKEAMGSQLGSFLVRLPHDHCLKRENQNVSFD